MQMKKILDKDRNRYGIIHVIRLDETYGKNTEIT